MRRLARLPRRRTSRSRDHHHRRQRQHRRAPGSAPRIWPSELARRARRAPRREGTRPRAAAGVGAPATARVVAYMDVDLSTDLNALLPLVAPLLSGHSDVAIGSRLSRSARVVRGPKRELISRSLQPDRCARRCAPGSPTRSAASRRCGPSARGRCCRTSATRRGSSTPNCWCSPSAAGCGSPRCRSTGSTIRTAASTSSRPRVADLRGVARLGRSLAARRPAAARAARAARPRRRRAGQSLLAAGDSLRRGRRASARSPTCCCSCCWRAPLGAQVAEPARAAGHRGRQHRRRTAGSRSACAAAARCGIRLQGLLVFALGLALTSGALAAARRDLGASAPRGRS